jgi:hypothetical protein
MHYVKEHLHITTEHWLVWAATAAPAPTNTVPEALRLANIPIHLRQPAQGLHARLGRYGSFRDGVWGRLSAQAALLRACWHPGLQRVYDLARTSPDAPPCFIEAAPRRPVERVGAIAHGLGEHAPHLARGLLGALHHLHDLALARHVPPPQALGGGLGGFGWDPLRPDEAPQLSPLAFSLRPDQDNLRGALHLIGGLVKLAAARQSPDAAPLRAWLDRARARAGEPRALNRALASLDAAFGAPERAALLDLDALAALERARAWLYEGRAEILGELALLRPSLFGQGPLSDYAWEHLGERLAGALEHEDGPAIWERALLARLPQARAVLAARMGSLEERPGGSAQALADLWIAHQPWPTPQDS